MSLPGYDPNDFDDDEIDESKLEPATDEEIREAIEQVLDEMDEELKEAFSDETLEREYGDFMREFEKAETIEDNDDNDKKGDSFWDRMIDDLIWGAPLGGGVGINLKTGNIIPYPSFDEDNHHDWDNDEFSFDDLADFADDEDNDDGDRTLSFSLTFDSNTTAPDFSPRDGKTIEEQYYDPQRNVYCVGRAIRDNFKEISESFSVEEMLDLSQSMFVIFSSNQKLALDATAWAAAADCPRIGSCPALRTPTTARIAVSSIIIWTATRSSRRQSSDARCSRVRAGR